MHLTRDEELLLQGERGDTLRRAMEILVALGDIYEAERLIEIKSAQIAGVSYKTIGDAGLEWISDLNGKVAVPSILNPAGMDLLKWREMSIDEDFARKQLAIIDAYRRLGVAIECTCTPYLLYESIASRGDHLAWSESSAVSYANSVIGAMTNREGGPSALAAALVGKTPLYGYHLEENRVPTHVISVEADVKEYGALGFLAGKIVGDGVPLFVMRSRPDRDDLKALGAAMAASGSVALYYVKGVTQEPPQYDPDACEIIEIEDEDIRSVYDSRADAGDVDIVALGCPHCSLQELEGIADLLEGRKVSKELWICTSRRVAESAPETVRRIESTGARVICDTCMVVSPASERFSHMMVNSGKAFVYIPGMCGVKATLGSLEDCINAATGGS
ncbi:MAG: aconitase X catalytic domain-containing protein [Methanothrix sp.]|nr:aconitase X catalytic domain-containing protein [Methanothrix sp.]MCX8207811.1 aconitase X catalytic domain-containing protein [Methanothrix sp.]